MASFQHIYDAQKERLALRLADIVALRVGKDNPAQLLVNNRAVQNRTHHQCMPLPSLHNILRRHYISLFLFTLCNILQGTKFNLQFKDYVQQEEWANIIKEVRVNTHAHVSTRVRWC